MNTLASVGISLGTCARSFLKVGCVGMHAQSPRTLCHGWTAAYQAPLSIEFFQARILEWVAISCSRGSSCPRGLTGVSGVSSVDRWILYH